MATSQTQKKLVITSIQKYKNYVFHFIDNGADYADNLFDLLDSPHKEYLLKEVKHHLYTNQDIVVMAYQANNFTDILIQNFSHQGRIITSRAKDLINQGVPIATPLGYGARYKYGFKVEQFTVRKKLTGLTLKDLLNNENIPDWEKNNAIYTVIDMYELIWAKGWAHGNISLENIIFINDRPHIVNILLAQSLNQQTLKKDKEMFLKCFKNHPLYGDIMIELGLSQDHS